MAIQATPHMTQSLGTAGNHGQKSFFSAINEMISGFYKSFTKSLQASRDFDELNKLTDRELQDIGITRGDIPYIVYYNDKRDQ